MDDGILLGRWGLADLACLVLAAVLAAWLSKKGVAWPWARPVSRLYIAAVFSLGICYGVPFLVLCLLEFLKALQTGSMRIPLIGGESLGDIMVAVPVRWLIVFLLAKLIAKRLRASVAPEPPSPGTAAETTRRGPPQ